eukprot:366551-Chlamydomonas_euryale.AAC.27
MRLWDQHATGGQKVCDEALHACCLTWGRLRLHANAVCEEGCGARVRGDCPHARARKPSCRRACKRHVWVGSVWIGR